MSFQHQSFQSSQDGSYYRSRIHRPVASNAQTAIYKFLRYVDVSAEHPHRLGQSHVGVSARCFLRSCYALLVWHIDAGSHSLFHVAMRQRLPGFFFEPLMKAFA